MSERGSRNWHAGVLGLRGGVETMCSAGGAQLPVCVCAPAMPAAIVQLSCFILLKRRKHASLLASRGLCSEAQAPVCACCRKGSLVQGKCISHAGKTIFQKCACVVSMNVQNFLSIEGNFTVFLVRACSRNALHPVLLLLSLWLERCVTSPGTS